MASPRDGEANRPRRVAESRQGNAIVAEHEEVGNPSPAGAADNAGVNLPQGFDFFINVKIKDVLTALNRSLNINLNLTQQK